MKLRFILICFCLIILTSCADSVSFSVASDMQPVGFWYGLWHGWICPFAWLISLFDPKVAIYAIYNNGGWYDFGFVSGAGILLGGSKAASK